MVDPALHIRQGHALFQKKVFGAKWLLAFARSQNATNETDQQRILSSIHHEKLDHNRQCLLKDVNKRYPLRVLSMLCNRMLSLQTDEHAESSQSMSCHSIIISFSMFFLVISRKTSFYAPHNNHDTSHPDRSLDVRFV